MYKTKGSIITSDNDFYIFLIIFLAHLVFCVIKMCLGIFSKWKSKWVSISR